MLWGHRWTHFYFFVKYVVCLSLRGGVHTWRPVGWHWASLWTWHSLIRLTGWPVSFSDPLVSTSLLGLQAHATSSSFYANAGDLNSHPHASLGQALHKEIYLPCLWWAEFKGEYLLLLPRDMQRSTLCWQGWVSYTQWSPLLTWTPYHSITTTP